MKRKFAAYYYFTGWSQISLGVHVCLSMPNIELHIPFGFVRIGMVPVFENRAINQDFINSRTIGFDPDRR